jgi:hypothetical protein
MVVDALLRVVGEQHWNADRRACGREAQSTDQEVAPRRYQLRAEVRASPRLAILVNLIDGEVN